MFLLPPLTAPDEIAHYATAYKWSNVVMGKKSVDENGHVYMRKEDAEAPFTHLNTKENYKTITDNLFKTCKESESVSFDYKLMDTSPIPYFPQAVGITLGRTFGLGWVMTMFLGRLMNLLVFILCGYLAVKWIPFGKMILFTVSMLPMTLELISSMSYDAMTLGLSLLFTAVCFRYAYVKETIGKKEVAVLAVLLGLLAPCKTVYILLGGLCLLIPKIKFKTKRFYWMSAVMVLGAAAASLLINNMAALSGYIGTGENYISWAGEPGYTAQMLLSDPARFVFLIFNTIREYTGFYISHMIGYELSWRNICIGEAPIIAFSFLLFFSCLKTQDDVYMMHSGERGWCIVLCTGTIFLVALSMLLGWTPASYGFIEGIQGRYFLPVLPLFLLAVRNRKVVIRQNIDKWIIFASVFLNVLVIQKIVAVSLA